MILRNRFLPELSHVDSAGEFPIFVTLDRRIGCIFSIPVVDLEASTHLSTLSTLDSLIATIPESWMLRVIQKSTSGAELLFPSFRTKAMNELGFVNRTILISIEKDGRDPVSLRSLVGWFKDQKTSLDREVLSFQLALPKTELKNLKARSLTEAELSDFFRKPQAEVSKTLTSIDFGTHRTGVIRLYKQGVDSLTEEMLSSLLDQIPLPYTVSVSVTKNSKTSTDFKLRSQLARHSVMTDSTLDQRIAHTEKALEETALHGASHCEVEWILTLERKDESTLRSDLAQSLSILRPLGEVMIETVGATAAYIASQVGGAQHFTFTESDRVCVVYLPFFSSGETLDLSSDLSSETLFPARTLLLHRQDGSLHSYDHFSPKFLAYNALITGKSGSGKSVLANALSSSLLEDGNILLIKIDVGGSYRKECEIYGGEEIHFSLDQPSGINPFRIFSETATSNEAISTLTLFLATLILEDNEKHVPKAVQADIEESLKKYAKIVHTKGKRPSSSIDHFIENTREFPRLKLLMRWAKGGVFENALKESPQKKGINAARYRYYNFENIGSASNRDFSEGIMAAVMAEVNLEMLRIASQADKSNPKRMVLFCDETKFFIERNAPFFLLTTANFRKFGHGVILMAQNIKNFELNIGGEIDKGLILNSPIRFFFQADTEADYLAQQFHFNENQLRAVVHSPYRGREYREAVLQDDTGTRLVRLYLTSEEYWRMTSSKEDAEKLNHLRAAVPKLSLEEAIACLSIPSQV